MSWFGGSKAPDDREGSMGLICCPFHIERTASLIMDFTEKTFHCMGCGRDGTITGDKAPHRILTSKQGEVEHG